jgi:hypothetical protein
MDFLNALIDPMKMASGGLLWKPLKRATGLTDAQMAGIGAMAVAAPFALPAMGAMGGAGAAGAAAGASAAPAASGAASGGLLSSVGSMAQPAMMGLSAANQAKQLSQGQPMQPGQLPQHQVPDVSGLLNAQTQQQSAFDADRQRRLQQQQIVMQGLLGGRNGIA